VVHWASTFAFYGDTSARDGDRLLRSPVAPINALTPHLFGAWVGGIANGRRWIDV
jgi:hypothetical protein